MTFLADVFSVVFAVGHAIGCDAFFTKKPALTAAAIRAESGETNATDLKATEPTAYDSKTNKVVTTEPVLNGHYVAGVDKRGLMETLKTLLTAEEMNVFDHATVWEDPGLNDADDFVATALIRKFSKTCHTDKFNWKEKVFTEENFSKSSVNA